MTEREHEGAVFTPVQKAAWAGFLRAHAGITRALSAALEREHGLTINEFEVLLCLSRDERLRLGELATRAYLSPSGLTGIIARLRGRGLVRRFPAPGDARSGYLELSESGRELFAEAVDAHVCRVQAWFLNHFTEREQRTLAGLWARIPDQANDLTEPPRRGT